MRAVRSQWLASLANFIGTLSKDCSSQQTQRPEERKESDFEVYGHPQKSLVLGRYYE